MQRARSFCSLDVCSMPDLEFKANSQPVWPCDLSDVNSNQQYTDCNKTTGIAFSRIALAQEMHIKGHRPIKNNVSYRPCLKTTKTIYDPLCHNTSASTITLNRFPTSWLVIRKEKGRTVAFNKQLDRPTKKGNTLIKGISPAGKQRRNNVRNTGTSSIWRVCCLPFSIWGIATNIFFLALVLHYLFYLTLSWVLHCRTYTFLALIFVLYVVLSAAHSARLSSWCLLYAITSFIWNSAI